MPNTHNGFEAHLLATATLRALSEVERVRQKNLVSCLFGLWTPPIMFLVMWIWDYWRGNAGEPWTHKDLVLYHVGAAVSGQLFCYNVGPREMMYLLGKGARAVCASIIASAKRVRRLAWDRTLKPALAYVVALPMLVVRSIRDFCVDVLEETRVVAAEVRGKLAALWDIVPRRRARRLAQEERERILREEVERNMPQPEPPREEIVRDTQQQQPQQPPIDNMDVIQDTDQGGDNDDALRLVEQMDAFYREGRERVPRPVVERSEVGPLPADPDAAREVQAIREAVRAQLQWVEERARAEALRRSQAALTQQEQPQSLFVPQGYQIPPAAAPFGGDLLAAPHFALGLSPTSTSTSTCKPALARKRSVVAAKRGKPVPRKAPVVKGSELHSHLCPILLQIMHDPVICTDGYSYERTAIREWLFTRDTSPLTGAKLESKDIITNRALQNSITEWQELQKKAISSASN